MMNDLVSVIIPIYNVEDYLERCINSVLKQTYTNLEIFLIDDGSTETSGKICNKYAQIDTRIKEKKKKNEGVSSARNTALSLCTGEYVCFVDSDDYVDIVYIEVLLKNLLENNGDISLVSYVKVKDHCEINKLNYSNKIETWNNKQMLEKYICENKFIAGVVCKIFPKSIVETLFFDTDIKIAEDKLFTFTALSNCNKIVYQEIPVYYYYQRQDSAMRSNFDDRFLGNKIVIDRLFEFWCNQYPELQKLFLKEKIISCVRRVQDSLLDNSKKSRQLRKIFLIEVKFCNYNDIKKFCNKKEKILFLIEKYCLWILLLFQNFKKIFK